jgi:hypothetical protein
VRQAHELLTIVRLRLFDCLGPPAAACHHAPSSAVFKAPRLWLRLPYIEDLCKATATT